MKILHSHETKSLFTNRNTKVLCLGEDNGIYTVWANYNDNQQVYNKGKSLVEACAWFLRRGDEKLVSIDEALSPESCKAARELEIIINNDKGCNGKK